MDEKMLSTHKADTHQPAARQSSRPAASRISPLWTIILVWAAGNLLLLVLQGMGFGVGFHVHPLGEDREFIRLMVNFPGLEIHRQFWATLESRNPLASWWYQAFSPLIFLRPEGLYLLRKLVDLFLGVSVYLLVNQISRGRLSELASACGVLVLFWNFSRYIEQLVWIPLIAFGLSILSVYFYCRYLDSGRAKADYIVVSLLLFFVALATYSIQCGVPIAVCLVSLLRRQETGGGWRLSSAVCGAIKDTAYFGILFVLFIQIWITTSVPMGNFFHLNPGFFLKHFLRSIANLVWNHDESGLVSLMMRSWSLWLIAASLGVSAILFYWLFTIFERKVATRSGAGSSVSDAMLVLAVFFGLAAPTILLESTTAIWFPGTRSSMLQQGFQPVFYLAILFLFTEYVLQRTGRGVGYVRTSGIALLCAFAVVTGLWVNNQLSEQSMFERRLETGLKEVVPSPGKPTHFVVKMKGMKRGAWFSSIAASMPSLFAQTAYNSNSVWLDPVYEGQSKALKSVIFGSNQEGLYSPESDRWIPYEDVVFVEFDGQRVTRLTNIDQATFVGYEALYAREKPLAAGF